MHADSPAAAAQEALAAGTEAKYPRSLPRAAEADHTCGAPAGIAQDADAVLASLALNPQASHLSADSGDAGPATYPGVFSAPAISDDAVKRRRGAEFTLVFRIFCHFDAKDGVSVKIEPETPCFYPHDAHGTEFVLRPYRGLVVGPVDATRNQVVVAFR